MSYPKALDGYDIIVKLCTVQNFDGVARGQPEALRSGAASCRRG
jgi:hypothetical protein